MKKLATIICLGALATAVYGQGTITIGNGTYALVRTNATAIGGGIGNTATTLGGFVYGVFTAPSAITSIGSGLDLLGADWHFTGVYATNSAVATGGRLNGGAGVPTLDFWPAGATNSYVLAGWSRNLGDSWSGLQSVLAGATFDGDSYLAPAGMPGFFGVSARAFGAAGGGATGLPAFAVFALLPNAQGTAINTGFDLFPVIVPEPGVFALIGIGLASLVIFRRRQ